MSHYYPPVDAATLRMLPVLMTQIETHGAAYLQEAPWPVEASTILTQVARWKAAHGGAQDGEDDVDLEGLEDQVGDLDVGEELTRVYKKLRRFGDRLGVDQVSEQVAFFRITTSLLTKLVEQMEKASNVTQYTAFRQAVMRILGDVMTADQRNEFLGRLSQQFGVEEPQNPA